MAWLDCFFRFYFFAYVEPKSFFLIFQRENLQCPSPYHCSPVTFEPLTLVYISCRLLCPRHIIPSMKHLHPLASCSSATLRNLWFIPLHISIMVIPPWPLAYSTMHSQRSGSVSTSTSQCFRRSIKCINASTQPEWLQRRICEQVSQTCPQLGQRGHRSVSHGLLPGWSNIHDLLACPYLKHLQDPMKSPVHHFPIH